MRVVVWKSALLLATHVLFAASVVHHHAPTKRSNLCDIGCDCLTAWSFPFLDCNRKEIRELPEYLTFPPNLEEITLKDNKIRFINKTTFSSAPRLQELDLSENGLRSVEDDSFAPLSGLVMLHLSHNLLDQVSEGLLTGLQNLRMLELGHNRLQALPAKLFLHVPDLRELRLQANHFGHLEEDTFRYLTLLEKLDLQSNAFVSLEVNLFQHTPRIHWLSLSGNSFVRFPKDVFAHTKALKSLDLSGNLFSTLQSGSFSSLRSVTSLYLNNQFFLKRIEKHAFVNMTSLKLLSCSYNKNLRFIHPEAFGSNENFATPRSIEKLFLGHNGFTSLREQTSSWKDVAVVDLNGNPWRCDCNLQWMMNLPKEISKTARCESPVRHHGKSIDTMTLEEFKCGETWPFPLIMLIAGSVAGILVTCGFAVAVIFYKTPVWKVIKTKTQFAYAKVPRKKHGIDLEWDPTADI